MSVLLAARTLIELAVVLLLIYGFIKEDKVIEFEQKIKMIIVVNYRRYKKRKRIEKIRKNGDFILYDGSKPHPVKRKSNSFHVAWLLHNLISTFIFTQQTRGGFISAPCLFFQKICGKLI